MERYGWVERHGSDDGAMNTHDYIWLSPDPDPILTSVAGPTVIWSMLVHRVKAKSDEGDRAS